METDIKLLQQERKNLQTNKGVSCEVDINQDIKIHNSHLRQFLVTQAVHCCCYPLMKGPLWLPPHSQCVACTSVSLVWHLANGSDTHPVLLQLPLSPGGGCKHTAPGSPRGGHQFLAGAPSSSRVLMSNRASSTARANLAALVSSQLLKAVMAMLMCSSMEL